MNRRAKLDDLVAAVIRGVGEKKPLSTADHQRQSRMVEARSKFSPEWPLLEARSKEYRNTDDGLKDIVAKAARSLIQGMPRRARRHLKNNVRIICANTDDAFGFFQHDSEAGYAVIVISTGLMILLNKLLKFEIAEHDISEVLFCNRYEVEQLTPLRVSQMRLEAIECYKQNNSQGPSIYLKNNIHAPQLLIQEAFIVAHEIAHYIDAGLLSGLITRSIPSEVDEINNYHASEYAADALGLYILYNSNFIQDMFRKNSSTKTVNTMAMENDSVRDAFRGMICSSICHFYENLKNAGHGESFSHPDPISRLASALLLNFGPSYTEAYQRYLCGLGPYPDWTKMEVDAKFQNFYRDALELIK